MGFGKRKNLGNEISDGAGTRNLERLKLYMLCVCVRVRVRACVSVWASVRACGRVRVSV